MSSPTTKTIRIELDLEPQEVELLYFLANASRNVKREILKANNTTNLEADNLERCSYSLYDKISNVPGILNLIKINRLITGE